MLKAPHLVVTPKQYKGTRQSNKNKAIRESRDNGSLQAMEMAEMLEIESALSWHLTSNHFPPVPVSMVPVCIEAIENANAGDWMKNVSLPEGIGYKGLTVAPYSRNYRTASPRCLGRAR